MRGASPRDGYDRIGPFHPYLVWAGVMLFNLMAVAAILTALTAIGDHVEDILWPGGPEWVEF